MNSQCKQQSPGFHHHNHKVCIDDALASAHTICHNKGLRLTPLRKQVLTYVWRSHKPLGAYAIMELLAADTEKQRRIAPPTVYRALDFLQEGGLVHRIASLNAYIGCCSPSQTHQSHFLICRACDSTVELATPVISAAIQEAAQQAGFKAENECVEIIGLCPNCQDTELGNHNSTPQTSSGEYS